MNILDQIVEHKKHEILERKRHRTVSSFLEMEHFSRSSISLKHSFGPGKPFGIIAEIKRCSPAAGKLRTSADPCMLAAEFDNTGAAAISVLTDESFFDGSLNDLEMVRESVQLPVLRKDFIIDEYQVAEAKAFGADAILLIASILDRMKLADLICASHEMGLECLVELYDAQEINKLDFDLVDVVGINNRDLRTFEIDLNRTLEIQQFLPDNVRLISESGIRTRHDVVRLMDSGVHGALVGETLMKADSPGNMLKLLNGKEFDASSR